MTLGDAIARVQAFSGVDTQTATDRVLARYRELVVRSRWRQAAVALGPTVAAQATYAVPDAVQQILKLAVGGQVYGQIGLEELWDLKAGVAEFVVVGSGGVFAPSPDASGVERFELWPVPSQGGGTIVGLCVIAPTDPASGDELGVPVDAQEAIVDGAIAMGLLRDDEQAADAQMFEGRFQQMVAELAGRKTARVGGGGGRRIPVRWS